MEALLILALILWMCYCLYRWQFWKDIAARNRSELDQHMSAASRHAHDAFNKGYASGLKSGVATMYRAATRAGASDMALDVMRMEGHRLMGTSEHDETETVDTV